jgi:group II intron reverse transcriptase/maturase
MDSANLLTKWHWIVELARKKPGAVLFSLNHVIDFEWMREAYMRTRKDGATGIDGVTAQDYDANLEANLRDLLERIKSGSYEAPPVRRVYLPKADGSQRPIGIPSFEDKVAQRAIAMALEAVYEQDFLTCSYGFRPGRSAHQALRQLAGAITVGRQRWVLDVEHLREILDQRVTDGVIRRMIDKWLKAGVLESGNLHFATEGTPQGGVMTPLTQKVTSPSIG